MTGSRNSHKSTQGISLPFKDFDFCNFGCSTWYNVAGPGLLLALSLPTIPAEESPAAENSGVTSLRWYWAESCATCLGSWMFGLSRLGHMFTPAAEGGHSPTQTKDREMQHPRRSMCSLPKVGKMDVGRAKLPPGSTPAPTPFSC